jgi:AcrR family transcriptional regulator
VSGLARRDKRADIVNAGIKVFSRKGFSRCSVEDILQEANVARATFYSYFDSKKDLFVELIDGILKSLFEIMATQLTELPANLSELQEKTNHVITGMFEFFRDNLEFAAIYIQEVMGMNPEIDYRIVEWQQNVAKLIRVILETGIQNGMFRPVDLDIISQLIAGAPQHLGLHLFLYTQEVDISRAADAVADYIIYGLAPRDDQPALPQV